MQHKALLNGYISAVAGTIGATKEHPLNSKLSLILTDFAPNGNKQGIPLREKQNILTSALNRPLKINFNGEITGHSGAIPIGPIINTYEGVDNGHDVIMADAIIWDDIYEDASEHIRQAFAEGVGTSWEIFYDSAEVDAEGVSWLQGCVFSGQCIVKVPAYGPSRTRILAIAEILHKDQIIEEPQEMTIKEETVAQDLTTERQELDSVREMLAALWNGLDELYASTFEIERETVTDDIAQVATAFSERITKLADHIGALKTKLSTSELKVAEFETKESERAEAELIATRKADIEKIGLVFEPRKEFYLGLSEVDFKALIDDIVSVKAKPAAQASIVEKPIIPEPVTSTNTGFTLSELSESLRNEFNKRG